MEEATEEEGRGSAATERVATRNAVNAMRRQRLERMSLAAMRRLRIDLDIVIGAIENSARREIDIATDHSGDPLLIAEVLQLKGDLASSKWVQVEQIYCSTARCPKCPHGDYHYEYRRSKAGVITVKFLGRGFDHGSIDRIGIFRIEGGDIIIEKQPEPSPARPR
jgi:hypothetical protein